MGHGQCNARQSGLRRGGMNWSGMHWRMDWSQPTRSAIGAFPYLKGGLTPTQADAGSWAFLVDVGDVNVIPANIEKSFDQIAKALSYVHEREVFPVILSQEGFCRAKSSSCSS